MAKLIFTSKDFAGRSYNLSVEKTTVGRGSHNMLVISDNSVSVNHCDILVYGSEVIIRDHNSTNGTFINGVQVSGQAPAKSGHVIRFGSVEARLELEPPTGTDLATDHTAIRAYSRAVREQRPAKLAPKPEAVLEPDTPNPPTDHTKITARPPPPAPKVEAGAATAPSGQGKSRLIWTVVVMVVVVGLMAIGGADGVERRTKVKERGQPGLHRLLLASLVAPGCPAGLSGRAGCR